MAVKKYRVSISLVTDEANRAEVKNTLVTTLTDLKTAGKISLVTARSMSP